METARFRMTGQRARVLRALTRGPMEDRSGLAVKKLAGAIHHESQESLALALVRLERLGLIQREVRGKRTYRIEITEEGRRALRLPVTSQAKHPLRWNAFHGLPAGPARRWQSSGSSGDTPGPPGGEDDHSVSVESGPEPGADPTVAPGAPVPALGRSAPASGALLDRQALADLLVTKALSIIEGETVLEAAEELRRAREAEALARRRIATLERELAEAKRRLFELDADLRVAEADNAILMAGADRTRPR